MSKLCDDKSGGGQVVGRRAGGGEGGGGGIQNQKQEPHTKRGGKQNIGVYIYIGIYI